MGGGSCYKLENLVNFPLNLDARQYLAAGSDAVAGSTLTRNQTMFKLYGVVNHIGGYGSGHYTAYVRSKGDQWTCCNDASCRPISEETVVSAHAYLLFYIRSDMEGAILSDVFPRLPGAFPKDTKTIRNAPLNASRQRAPQPRVNGGLAY